MDKDFDSIEGMMLMGYARGVAAEHVQRRGKREMEGDDPDGATVPHISPQEMYEGLMLRMADVLDELTSLREEMGMR